jgi:hypothetical protein
MKKLLLLIALVAGFAGATAAGASAQYGPGAVYEVELSMNIPGKQGGGVWLWLALNRDGTGDYAGADCGHGGQGAASDKGDVTWTQVGDQIVISGVTYNGIPTDPMTGDFTPFAPTISVPAGYGHYTGVDDTYTTLPGWIPAGVGFTQLQVAP